MSIDEGEAPPPPPPPSANRRVEVSEATLTAAATMAQRVAPPPPPPPLPSPQPIAVAPAAVPALAAAAAPAPPPPSRTKRTGPMVVRVRVPKVFAPFLPPPKPTALQKVCVRRPPRYVTMRRRDDRYRLEYAHLHAHTARTRKREEAACGVDVDESPCSLLSCSYSHDSLSSDQIRCILTTPPATACGTQHRRCGRAPCDRRCRRRRRRRPPSHPPRSS